MAIEIALSVLSLVVATFSLGLAVWVARRNEPRARARATFLPGQAEEDQPGGPPMLEIEIVNLGRRVIQLEYLYVRYGRTRADIVDTLWDSDETGRCHLREGDPYRHTFTPDDDGLLVAPSGQRATSMYFQDSAGRRYTARGFRSALAQYLSQASEW